MSQEPEIVCTVCNELQEKTRDDYQKCVHCGTYFIIPEYKIVNVDTKEVEKTFESYDEYEKEYFPKLHANKLLQGIITESVKQNIEKENFANKKSEIQLEKIFPGISKKIKSMK